MRGCATYWSVCQRQVWLTITKPCCRGAAHPQCLAECALHIESGGVYGALIKDRHQSGRGTHCDGGLKLRQGRCRLNTMIGLDREGQRWRLCTKRQLDDRHQASGTADNDKAGRLVDQVLVNAPPERVELKAFLVFSE